MRVYTTPAGGSAAVGFFARIRSALEYPLHCRSVGPYPGSNPEHGQVSLELELVRCRSCADNIMHAVRTKSSGPYLRCKRTKSEPSPSVLCQGYQMTCTSVLWIMRSERWICSLTVWRSGGRAGILERKNRGWYLCWMPMPWKSESKPHPEGEQHTSHSELSREKKNFGASVHWRFLDMYDYLYEFRRVENCSRQNECQVE